jgi:hypothetical protein
MTNYLLKMMAFIAAFAGMQEAVPLQAAVNMISVQHRVWGNAGWPVVNSYDETGPAPLSGNANGISDFGSFTDDNYASSTASDWSTNAFRDGAAYDANAYAQNTYVFMPFSREISISLNGVIGVWWFENQAYMRLTNRSTNFLVSSYHSPSYTGIPPFAGEEDDMVEYPFSWDATVEVNPEDEYELIIFVGARSGEGGDGSASLNLTLVPEPGTTLLAGMAALFICGRRHRPKVTH